MGRRIFLKDIYGWVWLFRAHLLMGVSGCDSLRNIYRYVCLFRILSWVGVTVENAFMGGYTFLEYVSVMGRCGCLWLLNPHLWVVALFLNLLVGDIGVCDCLKHIYGWVWLFRAHLWIGMNGCDCLKPIYG